MKKQLMLQDERNRSHSDLVAMRSLSGCYYLERLLLQNWRDYFRERLSSQESVNRYCWERLSPRSLDDFWNVFGEQLMLYAVSTDVLALFLK
ncbi:unnamed protein product [Gongylonema pulchrum]|uniref:Calpain catalytic domain-containing protein n=1 Tax=Gongylonema pulchrum TaxID=637853 RepID=A0A183DY57_9BILA|nr:unnamed protein product [Gongylonema pulchrum]